MSVIVDYKAHHICWIDAFDQYIYCADVNGIALQSVHYSPQNIFPADLAMYHDLILWVDWNSQSIEYFNRTRPLQLRNFGHLSDVLLTGVVVSDASRQPVGKS